MVIRAFLPHAKRVYVLQKGAAKHKMKKIHHEGLFEATFPKVTSLFKYQLIVTDKESNIHVYHDPYTFPITYFSNNDLYLFCQGKDVRLFEKLGAHRLVKENVHGINFAVWAPNAQRVSVVGTFNRWDGRCHQMRLIGESGIWEIFIPDIGDGELYKYEIKTQDGDIFLKTDPYAFYAEVYPKTASIVYDLKGKHEWYDGKWMEKKAETNSWELPVFIYEVDMNSWMIGYGKEDKFLTYRELSEKLIPYVKDKGFTHIELSPFGPEPSGHVSHYYAPDAQYGKPEDLMAFVDICHQNGIGVIVDWMPSHFPEDSELAWFDGTHLYEQEAPGEIGTLLFYYEKSEVKNYLIANALFWVEKYHVDGLRADSVAFVLYMYHFKKEHERLLKVKVLVKDHVSKITISKEDINKVTQARHNDPHSVLGPHYLEREKAVAVRAFLPHADQVYVLREGSSEILYRMNKVHEVGLFETIILEEAADFKYQLHMIDREGNTFTIHDPYAITSSAVTEHDRRLFAQGNHYRIFERFGAHPMVKEGIKGVNFAIWAPNAERVSVVGLFNQWDGRYYQMRLLGDSGIWEIFIPGLDEGEIYKYEIRTRKGDIFLKTDPYAFHTEVSPKTASIIYELKDKHPWNDGEWMQRRVKTNIWERPVSIYEVHMGSWMRKPGNKFLSYRERAEKLIPYVKDMGFTHIELLPIAEHPYDPSWGYQITNFYAPTSRFGRPEDLMEFVDICHQNDIGVILDWVPAHFPKDAHALASFDGTCLYEHADPRKGEHRDWGTLIFNYGRHEVENFLIANALFWLETYHFDGLRVDAVASMLYLDYSRREGEWLPNIYGGNENLEAIEFLKHTNTIVSERFPGVMMIAEESTAWPNVSKPTEQGGLGFGFKWNMGWMHDILFYMKKDPVLRRYHHKNLTFGLVYAFNENFILSLSHDEVVHLKGSLIHKMSGDEWQKFANLRLLYTFMYAHPGKKLLFMGGEFGQISEWDHATSLEWNLLEREPHECLKSYMKDLNRLYHSERAFYEVDFKNVGFEWIDPDNAEHNVIAFIRKAKDPRNCLFFAMNFSPVPRENYRMGVPFPGIYMELLNSDAKKYWGSGKILTEKGMIADEIPWHGYPFSISFTLPPLGAVILKPLPPEM